MRHGKVKCRKAINFDLDTAALKKYYPNENYRNAYRDIKTFMKNEGFEHRQGSGYNSKEKITGLDIHMLTKKISRTFPWLKKCVNRFDVTDIGEQHDLTHLITGKPNAKIHEIKKEAVQEKQQAVFTVKQLKVTAERIRRQPKVENSRDKTKNKDMEL